MNLNYDTYKEAYNDAGKRFGYKPNTIKNRRDDFDSIHDNGRNGWYQKELSKNSLEIIDTFGHISEDAMTEIVRELLSNNEYQVSNIPFGSLFTEPSKISYNRGLTGKKAELLFMEYFKQNYNNLNQGKLVDTRDEGCGYDFKLEDTSIVFEVKGLSSKDGGISFTDKEWATAKEKAGDYNLVVISDVFTSPNIKLINNPYKTITPTKRYYSTLSIMWSIQSKKL